MRFFFIVLILNSTYIFAQNFLSGKINCGVNRLNISEYYFNDLTLVDTINIDKEGSFKYNLDKLKYGEYNLKSGDINIDFIYNNENIILFDDCNNEGVVQFKKSVENNLLNKFFNFYYINNTSYSLLNQLLKFYPKSDIFYNKIKNRKKELNIINNNFIDSLSGLSSSLLVSKISKLYKYSENGFIDIKTKYDTSLIRTRFIGDLIISYLNTYENKKYDKLQQQQFFKYAVDTILLSFSKNKLLTLYVADFLIEKFRFYDLDLVYEYTALKTSELIDLNSLDLSQKFISQKVNNINNIVNSRVGNKAFNFKINKKQKLYDIKNSKKIIVFWASWCPHCDEIINELNEVFTESYPNIPIITYSLDIDKNKWEQAITDNNKKWINICECNNKDNIPDKYSVYATPTIFLLDSDNKIIGKPKNLEELLDIIDNE